MPFQILSHTADTGVEAAADSLAELIDQLATGMFASMAPIEPCPPASKVEIEIVAPTLEDLVADTLSELIYEAETEDLMLCGFHTRILGRDRLRMTAGGVAVTEVELCGPPIKAVTYHDLTVTQGDGGWYGRVYFDV